MKKLMKVPSEAEYWAQKRNFALFQVRGMLARLEQMDNNNAIPFARKEILQIEIEMKELFLKLERMKNYETFLNWRAKHDLHD